MNGSDLAMVVKQVQAANRQGQLRKEKEQLLLKKAGQ
jgi:hypothetical protein